MSKIEVPRFYAYLGYDVVCDTIGREGLEPVAVMRPAHDGGYVQYSDHARVVAQLEAELEELRARR